MKILNHSSEKHIVAKAFWILLNYLLRQLIIWRSIHLPCMTYQVGKPCCKLTLRIQFFKVLPLRHYKQRDDIFFSPAVTLKKPSTANPHTHLFTTSVRNNFTLVNREVSTLPNLSTDTNCNKAIKRQQTHTLRSPLQHIYIFLTDRHKPFTCRGPSDSSI